MLYGVNLGYLRCLECRFCEVRNLITTGTLYLICFVPEVRNRYARYETMFRTILYLVSQCTPIVAFFDQMAHQKLA